MSRVAQYQSDPAFQIISGACPHDCPDACSWQVAVDRASGRAVDIWGHADHPITQGGLCGKVDRYLERTYHPERLHTPLKRIGAKGPGSQFVPISWHEALTEISQRLQQVIDEYGAEAVLPYSYSGTLGYLQGEGMATRFFNRMGASQLARTICAEAGFHGYSYTLGAAVGMEPESYAHAQLILIWGSNTLTSNMHLWPFIQQARKEGARVIVIDPARTRTARAADEWIAIHPGTDAALALAMMHVIINEKLHDADYVAQYTVGFEELHERVQEWTPERAAQITGVSAQRIIELARDYATTRPAAIRINYGLQRHAGGGMAVRTVACLPALVGAWREYGGGIQLSTSGGFRHMNVSVLIRLGQIPNPHTRIINMIRLGDALSLDPAQRARALYHPRPVDPVPTAADAGAPVKALMVYNSNPAAVCPDQGAVLAALRRDDLFTVVMEHFQTDTADYADYILPATTQLEHWDLLKSYGHYYLMLNRPAIAPVGQSLPNSEIFRRLASSLGYTEECFQETDEEILRKLIESQRNAVFETVTWDKLLQQGFARLNLPQPYLPFAAGNFPTPSGKCEFYSQRMAKDGYDPLPTYTPPLFAGEASGASDLEMIDADADSDQLACISPPAHSFLNSTFVNLSRFQQREKEPLLWLHPQDAGVRGIESGQPVRVWNELGSVTLTARVTPDIAPGVVLAPGVWWNKLSGDGRNINQVTPPNETDIGAGAIFYDVSVRVALVEREAERKQPVVELVPAD